jgi:hypothetical protein
MVLAWDGKLGGDDPTLIETFSRHARRYPHVEWVPRPMVAALIATVLILSFDQHAWALDCLAYKPAGARGQWHADVVAGKICWYGPNWRSFLPKPKLQAESAQAVKSKPDGGAASLSRSAEPAPLAVGATDTETLQDLPALRAATPAEAAALINAVSLEFDSVQPEPSARPKPTVARYDMIVTIIAIIALAIGGLALTMLFYKRRKHRAAKQKLVIDADAGRGRREQGLERLRVSPPIAALELPYPGGDFPPARRRVLARPGRD